MRFRKYSFRFGLVYSLLILCLVVFTGKLVYLQVFHSSHLASLAKKQHNSIITLEPRRGAIYDRNMRPLAFNVTVSSLYANPRDMSVEDKERATRELSRLIDRDQSWLRARLERDKYFVWIERKMLPDLAEQVKALDIHGLGFIKESKRFYPNQTLAAHTIGFAGTDNVGLEGLELKYDETLKGEPGFSQILRDARQNELLIEKNYIAPKNGLSLVLTIDETIQFLAERALEKAYTQHNAKGGTIILLDPRTGEVLALANRPTYDLGEVSKSSIESRTNRSVNYYYEPGSVFKIVAASAALEEGVFAETDKIFCENGAYRIANHTLHDHHSHGTLTFKEVFEQSSNIGVAKIAQEMGGDQIYRYARRFRFGRPTNIDLSGEVGGVLKHPSEWSKTSIGAIPMGQEVTTTPIQLAAAIAAIANDGVYMQPFVVKYIQDDAEQVIRSFEPKIVDTVITSETAQRVQAILEGVVLNGTGKRAQIEGVRVGGKTGTAQKVVDGTYSHSKFYASFIGFAPVDNPKIAGVVVFDEPHPNHYGGTVSAPVFQEVVEDALKYLESKRELERI